MAQQPTLFGETPAQTKQTTPIEVTADSTVLDTLPAFVEHLHERSLAENTIRCFRNDIELLAQHIGETKPISACNTQALRQYLSHLQDRERPSAKTRQRRTTTLKAFFGWLVQTGALPNDPAASLGQTPSPVRLPRVLGAAERDRLIATARQLAQAEEPDTRPYLLVSLLLATGIKKAECLGIRLDDLYLDATPAVTIQPATKNARPRYLRLPDEFPHQVARYRRHYNPKEYLFECTGRNLEYVLDDLRRQAGIGRRVGFRVLRWTSAVDSLRNGMDPETLRLRLGLAKTTWIGKLALLEQLAQGPL
jgi:site-specific recombinase XerD